MYEIDICCVALSLHQHRLVAEKISDNGRIETPGLAFQRLQIQFQQYMYGQVLYIF